MIHAFNFVQIVNFSLPGIINVYFHAENKKLDLGGRENEKNCDLLNFYNDLPHGVRYSG